MTMSIQEAEAHNRPPSPTERMRLHRKRRRSGTRCVHIQLDAMEIDALIRRGYLDQESREDRCALAFGIDALLWDTLVHER